MDTQNKIQREIKFRAWDYKTKMMYTQNVSIHTFRFKKDVPWELVGLRGLICDHTDGTLMQFTGFKDKNGKKIYEGDILSLIKPREANKQTEFGIVEVRFGEYDDSEIDYGSPAIGWFVVGYHGYNRTDGTKDKYKISQESLLICMKSDWDISYEVIGNIWENPELLK